MLLFVVVLSQPRVFRDCFVWNEKNRTTFSFILKRMTPNDGFCSENLRNPTGRCLKMSVDIDGKVTGCDEQQQSQTTQTVIICSIGIAKRQSVTRGHSTGSFPGMVIPPRIFGAIKFLRPLAVLLIRPSSSRWSWRFFFKLISFFVSITLVVAISVW